MQGWQILSVAYHNWPLTGSLAEKQAVMRSMLPPSVLGF